VVACLLSEEGLDRAVYSQARVYSHSQRCQQLAARRVSRRITSEDKIKKKTTIMFMVSWGRRSPATISQPCFLLHEGTVFT
jgi:hypothetical protein